MGIFDDVGSWLKNAAVDVYDVALKPIGSAVADATSTVWNGGVSIVNRVTNFGEKTADAGLNFVTKEGDAINKFSETLSNPIFMIGALIAAVVILPKILK